MNRHLTDEEILDLLAPGAVPGSEVRAHLDDCAECERRLDAERPLTARLEDLPRELDPPRDAWPAVRTRIGSTAPNRSSPRAWLRPILAAAAAAVMFVLGAAVGRSLGPDGGAPIPVESSDPLVAAAAVQRAGTDYVAAVARFRAIAPESSSPTVEQARDVALAAVHGAAFELARLQPGDATAREIVALAGERRLAAERP